MKPLLRRAACLGVVAVMAGCSPPVTAGDGFTPGDVATGDTTPTMDEGPGADAGDASMSDVPTDRRTDGGTDARPGDVNTSTGGPTCSAAEIVDLNAMGMRTGETVRFTGSNAGAAATSDVAPDCTEGTASNVRAFRYVPRASVRLAVSTNNAGTDENLDTVVWVQTACAASPSSLACNDDDPGADDRLLASTAVTEAPVPANMPVFIFVGGLREDDVGPFELTVTEVTQVALGGACDPRGALNFCAGGATCVPGSTPTAGTCVAPGGRGAACRESTPACDATLACNSSAGSVFGRCVPVVAPGGACDVFSDENVCSPGASCDSDGESETGHCIVDGANGGQCRATGTACETGLACDDFSGRCRPVVAVGATCDREGLMNACAPGSSCQGEGEVATGTCVADGARGGRCRRTGTACEAGFACNGAVGSFFSRCLPAVAVGGMCDGEGATNACAAGSSCVVSDPDAEPLPPGVCVADGARNGRCRATGAACESGLACSAGSFFAEPRCRTAVAPGAACDDTGIMNACAAGSTCLETGTGTMTTTTCVSDGSRDARCRTSSTGAACETGLTCSGPPADFTTRCRTTVAMGAECDPRLVTNACATSLQCVVPEGGAPPARCTPAPYTVAPLTGADATFIDACAMGGRQAFSSGSSRDDVHTIAPVRMPFSVRFFGASYMNVWPSVNGYTVLGSTVPIDTTGGPGSLPSGDEGAVVAPFWQDLALRPSPMSDVCTATVGAMPARRFVIQWSNAQSFGADGTYLDFEAVLNESNTVDFIYRRMEAPESDRPRVNGSRASIGLQSPAGARWADYLGAVAAGTALRFTPR